MKRKLSPFVFFVVAVSSFFLNTLAYGGVASSGDVAPANPNLWDQDTYAYIGKTGSGSLSITDGGNVTSASSHIGFYSGSQGRAVVDGVGSSWNSNGLSVGGSGRGSISITNGGNVTTISGDIGYSSGSTGNAVVDGVNSSWNSSWLNVGDSGSGSLSIINGGHVTSTSKCYIGYKVGSVGSVAVDGSGSSFKNSDFLWIAKEGSGSLSITNGGNVTSRYVAIGSSSESQGSAIVDGVGSSWNLGWLSIGDGDRASLSITNGGIVTVADETRVSSGDGDGVINFDGGSLTTKTLTAGTKELKGTGTVNTKSLIVDADLVFESIHGLNPTFVMSNSSDQNITINLDADGSGILGAGYSGTGSMSITEGVSVVSTRGYVGYKAGSVGSVIVDGVGSSWNSGSLHIGSGSSSGSLSITNGGIVTVTHETSVGEYDGDGIINFDGGTLTTKSLLAGSQELKGTGTINTKAIIVDTDLVFDSTHGLSQTFVMNNSPDQNITINLYADYDTYLGAGYSGNGSINITEGVMVASRDGYIGYKAGSHGSVTIDGIGSTWFCPSYGNGDGLIVGGAGNGSLSITNGGHLQSPVCYIGSNAGSVGSVVVDGVGSIWDRSNCIHVGCSGNGSLSITNGGSVISNYGSIGDREGSIGSVVVDGYGSSWTSNDLLLVGDKGNGSLSITNGGHVTSESGKIGYDADSVSNVVVDGVGSSWNSNNLIVGNYGSASLSITNGGSVTSDKGYISYHYGPGSVTVDGVGSSWFNSEGLSIGRYGVGTLSISNGGMVTVGGETKVGAWDGTGVINFNGGTLTTESLLAGSQELKGVGTINTKAIVADADLVFDSTHGHSQAFVMNNSSEQNIKINLDANGSGFLGAGYSGTGSMSVTEGATVTSIGGYIGYKAGSVGSATVDGIGSSWNNSGYLHIGKYGSGSLSITDGGNVTSDSACIGCESDSVGNVVVDGVGSSWNNSGGLTVGGNGEASLSITNGGVVTSGSTVIGYLFDSVSSVTVDGVSSSLDNLNGLYVGRYGEGTLSITNGAIVTTAGETRVGTGSVTGVINFDEGTLDTESLLAGTKELKGTGIINTHGIVTDIDLLFDSTHGLTQAIVLDNLSEQNIAINLDVDGSGSLGAGCSGYGSMSIKDGSVVAGRNGYIGLKAGSVGNVVVDGVGSSWNSSDCLYVGNSGSGSLSITNGGNATSASSVVGRHSGSVGSVLVDGDGSSWQNSGSLYVGNRGNASISIANGGSFTNTADCYIGYYAGAQGGVVVDGVGSSWQSSGLLLVGYKGSGSLSITNGGNVISDHAGIGYGYHYGYVQKYGLGSVVVDGVGSSWVSSELDVGNGGSGSLLITNGGNVTSDYGSVAGYRDLCSVVIDGVGSSWTSKKLSIGNEGDASVTITNGGNITSDHSYIGGSFTYLATAVVDGAGSSWDSSRDINIGDSGRGSLTVLNGGTVTSYNSYISLSLYSTGEATIDGVGSSWDSSGWLSVGNYGRGSLSITNGGHVTSAFGYIGQHSISAGSVVVDGVGSRWDNSGNLSIGDNGRGSLKVLNGGTVTSHNADIGISQDSNYSDDIGISQDSKGYVIIDGVGSSWQSSGWLSVGDYSEGSLAITNGGHATSGSGYIAYYLGSAGDVIVDGAGSSWLINGSGSDWDDNGSLDIGHSGSGSLSITNGGIVIVDGILTIATNFNRDTFIEMSTGGMLALSGDADSSITDFLALVQGRDRIRFWDESVHDWRNIMNASIGDDYTLEYISDVNSDLYDHTVLTVTAIPEPVTIAIFALGCLGIRRRQ